MSTEEVGRTLPNGFYDSDILGINIDYARGEVAFLLDVDLSSPEEKVEAPSRRGELRLTGLPYCVIEPPGYSLANRPASNNAMHTTARQLASYRQSQRA